MLKEKSQNVVTSKKVISSKKQSSTGNTKLSKSVKRKVRSSSTVIFPGFKRKAEGRLTAMEKMERLKVGISKNELEKLKIRAKLDYDKLSKLLSVTRATLINKQGSEKFNIVLSERIIGLADIYSYGYEVFENEEKFNQWMFKENQALGGKTPYEVCNNQFGREEVKNIIGRIDYGVYS